ncbi:MAG: GGDEF domain-containing protein [Pseudomonadota bacterium]|nr:GGDEF domain-containing protein [Pseudomonadota bacterium]
MSIARIHAPPSFGRTFLGHDAHQRLRASQNLLALMLNGAFALVQQFEVDLGLVEQSDSNWLSMANIGVSLVFFAVIRSGLNLRLAPAEPSLTLPQCLSAVTAVTWSYAITGPARGALLALLILIIQFGGLFRLDARRTRLLSLYAFLSLAGVMAWRTGFAERRYDPQVELVNFAFTALVLVGANVVAGRFGQLRERLSRQKGELAAALELNRELATRDMLTGLLNRRAMVEMLARPAPRTVRGDGRMALAIIDIDFFKRINDSCGHNVGDAVLHRFAQVLEAAVRKGDLLARWGGEEFLLLMPGITEREGLQALARLRAQVAAEDWAPLVGDLPVTFSAGLSGLVAGQDHEAAIERADRALYRAKDSGRDRVEIG